MRDCQQLVVCGRKHACVDKVVTDQLPSVADFLVAVSSVSTQGRHIYAGPNSKRDENSQHEKTLKMLKTKHDEYE